MTHATKGASGGQTTGALPRNAQPHFTTEQLALQDPLTGATVQNLLNWLQRPDISDEQRKRYQRDIDALVSAAASVPVAPLPVAPLQREPERVPERQAEHVPEHVPERERERLLPALAGYLAGDVVDYDALRLAWVDLPPDRAAALAWVRAQPDLAGAVFQVDLSHPIKSEPDHPVTTWADMARIIGPIQWAWQGWLPVGLLTILAGDPEKGKSLLALRIAACYLRGDPWPDGAPFTGEKGAVLWCEAEAAQAVNLERASKWGLSLHDLITPLSDPLEDVLLDDTAHRAIIASEASRPEVKLIVVDSLRGAHRRDENSSELVMVVKWLAELARNTGKPVILLHHLRKKGLMDDGESITLDRLRGSSALVQPARVVWALDAPDPAQPRALRLSVIKNNLGRRAEPIGFTVGDHGPIFGDAPQTPRRETLQDKAADLLLALLAKGPRLSTELEAEFEGAGLSFSTGKKAKEKMGIVSIKSKDGWLWALPARE